MTVKNTCENLSHTEESPTLHPGQRYLSLIAHVNGPLGQRLVDWKKRTGMTLPTDLSNHVTVYVSELTEQNENDWRSDALAHSLAAIGTAQARAGGVCTFRPNSEVEYLDIILGADTFTELHGACVQELGQWASPFPYVPHITLGRSLTPDQVRQAHRIFDDLPEQERSFTVDTLHVYAYDGADWEPLGALSLKS